MTKRNVGGKTLKPASSATDGNSSLHSIQAGHAWVSAAVLETLIEGSSEVVFLYGMDRRLHYVSSSFENLTGYKATSLRKKHFINYFHPDDQDTLLKAWEEVFSGREFSGQFRCVTKQKAIKWCSASWKPVRDSQGRQIGVLRKDSDLTDRKKPEDAIRGGMERYFAILDNIEISYFELDLKGNIIFFNNNVCKDLGYTREELLGLNFRACTKPGNVSLVKGVFQEIYRTGMPKTLVNIELIKKDGSTMFAEQSASVMREPSGGVIGFQGVLRDITERIQAERALKRSEEKYRRILETIEDGYYETDLRGNLVFFNKAGWKNSGYEPDELMGMNYKAFTTPESSEFLFKIFHRVYETGRSEGLLDYEVILKNGFTRYHETAVGLLRDESGQPSGFHILARDITRRKIAEQALRQSEEKYRTILETMDEGLFENDLAGNYAYVNDAACRLMGYERDELIGKNYQMCHPPETMRYLNEVYSRMYVTGESEILKDYEGLRKDGTIRIHQANTAFIRDGTGKIIGFRALVRDITERKKAEDDLRKSEERYRTILETIGEGYGEYDLSGTIMFVNDAACKLLGYDRDELIGMNYRMYHTPEVAKYIRTIFNRMYQTGKPEFLLDYEVIRKDGSIRTCQLNAAPLRNVSGQPIGFRVLARDVTERRSAEEAFRMSEEKYRTILEIMEIGYFEFDLKGTITFVNDAACRLTGFERDELIGIPYKNYHPPDDADRMYDVFHRIYETGKPEFLMDYKLMRKDGSVGIHQLNVALLRDSSGKPAGFRTLAKDVTELKKVEEEKAKIEEQLLQAKKMESVGRLAGGVAHDFNNMLTVILGYAELIKSRLPQNDPILSDMGEIEKAAGRSRDLTRQLLAFSRKEIIAPSIIDLNVLIINAKKTIPRLIGEDIDLKFYPGNDLWRIMFDPSQMEHILINLAANARDAMPNGGKLTIETENVHLNEAYCRVHPEFSPGHYVMLGVSDDGIGMDEETAEHIFEPFFTTKETGKGTGLGLAMVYGIIRQNGGFINVYSEPGKGTTFKMYIPRSIEQVPEPEEDEEISILFGEGTVLLVEDDEMVRKMTAEMLEAIGFTTLSTGDPKEALALIEGETPMNLVITDVVMPVMSGKELSKRIEAVRPGMRVLFMSGYTTNVIAHRGVLDEGVHFIQKPFSLGDLALKIRGVLRGR